MVEHGVYKKQKAGLYFISKMICSTLLLLISSVLASDENFSDVLRVLLRNAKGSHRFVDSFQLILNPPNILQILGYVV